MKYYVSVNTVDFGEGTKARPFTTISAAAQVAKAGDEVIVAPGIYRECVDPLKGGDNDNCRIVYRSEKKGGAVITGAEVIKNWVHYQGDVWTVEIPNSLFGEYNPYTTIIKGDWFFGTVPLHTGEVYLNGKSMYEMQNIETVVNPQKDKGSWSPDDTVYTWFTEQKNGCTILYGNFQGKNPNEETVEINVRQNCFYPSGTGRNYITLSGFVIRQAATQWAPPTAYQEGMVGPHWSKGWIIEECEISDSKCSGISLGKYLQPQNENKWTRTLYKDGTQTERDAICQAQLEGWTKENIGSHIVRRCEIHDCGQTGIVGHLGGAFSVIEDNHIHHINYKQDLIGAEIGGIKMHAAIDTIFRRNHIHHCTRGMWLDWQAQGTRVTQNLFHDNIPPEGTKIKNGLSLGEDIFIEVSHGPTLIDNNLLLSEYAARISTQGVAFVHNLIAGSFTYVGMGVENGAVKFPSQRFTPYHVPHRTEVAGFMTILGGDIRFYNNIFVQQKLRTDIENYVREIGSEGLSLTNSVCGTKPYDGYLTAEEYFGRFDETFIEEWKPDGSNRDAYYDHLPVYTGGNVYFNGSQPCDKEQDFYVDTENTVMFELQKKGKQYILKTDIYDYLPKMNNQVISTVLLGEAFEPEQRFEQPDGSPIIFDVDYMNMHRTAVPLTGPFAEKKAHFEL